MNDMPLDQTRDETAKILYVDDEDKALKYFRIAFGQTYPVLTASSVDEALEVLEQHSHEIGVLVTDQRMPGRTGVELLDHMREHHPHVIRILTTAYADLEDAIAAVNRGEIFRYVTKPWVIESLGTELKQAMDFFNLRQERDLLLNEKLSVHRRQSQLNRARDLIIMAASLPDLRHTQQATYAYLEKFIRHLDISNSDVEHWQGEEQEIQRSIAIATMTGSLSSTCQGSFADSITVSSLLQDFSQLDVEGATSMVQISVDLGLIKMMMVSAITAMGGDNNTLSASVDTHDQICVHLSRSGGLTCGNEDLDAWLSAYLIAYHHGGNIDIDTSNNETRCTICLPGNPASVTLGSENGSRMDEIFSQLEELD